MNIVYMNIETFLQEQGFFANWTLKVATLLIRLATWNFLLNYQEIIRGHLTRLCGVGYLTSYQNLRKQAGV